MGIFSTKEVDEAYACIDSYLKKPTIGSDIDSIGLIDESYGFGAKRKKEKIMNAFINAFQQAFNGKIDFGIRKVKLERAAAKLPEGVINNPAVFGMVLGHIIGQLKLKRKEDQGILKSSTEKYVLGFFNNIDAFRVFILKFHDD